jgi:glutathione S-transferase
MRFAESAPALLEDRMAKNNTITLYDLQLSTGATISPFVWATKLAVAHKGFDLDIVPGGFTGIMERTGGRSERLPAIVDDGHWVLDSWLIAEYLDEKYPDRPTLIGDPSVKVLTRIVETWLWQQAISPWMTCYLKSYRDLSLPQDHEYVTESRERMFGRKLEDIVVGREERLPKVPPNLEILRQALRESPWLGGETPNYADHRHPHDRPRRGGGALPRAPHLLRRPELCGPCPRNGIGPRSRAALLLHEAR